MTLDVNRYHVLVLGEKYVTQKKEEKKNNPKNTGHYIPMSWSMVLGPCHGPWSHGVHGGHGGNGGHAGHGGHAEHGAGHRSHTLDSLLLSQFESNR